MVEEEQRQNEAVKKGKEVEQSGKVKQKVKNKDGREKQIHENEHLGIKKFDHFVDQVIYML